MLKLNDPVRYTDEEKAHIEANLKPKGKNGWSDSAPETIAIKHHISEHTIIAQVEDVHIVKRCWQKEMLI